MPIRSDVYGPPPIAGGGVRPRIGSFAPGEVARPGPGRPGLSRLRPQIPAMFQERTSTGPVSWVYSLTESFSLTDSLSRLARYFRIIGEAFTYVDFCGRLGELQVTWTDSTDPGVTGNNIYRSSLTGGPYSLLANVATGVQVYDDFSVLPGTTYYYVLTSVSASGESGFSPEQSETSPLTSKVQYFRTMTEGFSLADLVTGISSSLGHWVRSLAETFSLADSLSRLAGYSRAGSENFTFSDSTSKVLGWLRTLSESFAFSDSLSRAAVYSRALAEQFSFSDAVQRLAAYFRTLAESFTFSDSVTGLTIFRWVKSLAESFSFSDTVSRLAAYRRTDTSEAFSFSDSLSRLAAYSRSLAESFSLADSVSRLVGKIRTMTESFSFSDSGSTKVAYLRTQLESFSFSDAISYVKSGIVHWASTLTEAFAFSDSASRLASYSRPLTDALSSVADSLSSSRSYGRTQQETFALTDSVSRSARYSRALAEAFTFSDLLSLFNPLAKNIVKVAVSLLSPAVSVSTRLPSVAVIILKAARATVTIVDPLP